MDLSPYVKRLALPEGFDPPRELRYEDVVARAITRDDVAEDVRGINVSLDVIRRTRGGAWPTGPVTEEDIVVDEYWHECEFRDWTSFAYILRTAAGYLGCAYLYPLGRRQPLTPELAEHDVDVSWWVTPQGHASGHYDLVGQALARWATVDFPFRNPYVSNVDRPRPR